jgi:hypothetical protein
MAIDNGIVYEAQKTGVPVGYVTITNSTKAGIWTALGKWQVVTTVAKKTEPTSAPPNPGDGRPRLKRPSDSSSSSSSQPTSSPTPDAGRSGDDRPRLHRPNDSSGSSSPSASPSASPTPDSSSESSGGSDDDRPRLHRPNERPAEDTASPSPTPASAPSLNQDASQNTPAPSQEPPPEDSDRPVLRRRSPSTATAAPTPAATPAPSAKATPVPQGTISSNVPKASAAGTQDLVAVSDNQPYETRSYVFIWKAGEQEAMEAKMRKLALAQLPKENAQLNDGSLRNVMIRSFDLDLSNDAVMVLTAEVPGSYLAPGGKTGPAKKGPGKAGAGKTGTQNTGLQDKGLQDKEPGKFVSRYITLIARVDFDGVPQRLAVSVTDSSRLDVAPRLELIDAVDVDGDGLAELLFREYSFDQKGFIVYGIGRSTVTKVFEGASQDLK